LSVIISQLEQAGGMVPECIVVGLWQIMLAMGGPEIFEVVWRTRDGAFATEIRCDHETKWFFWTRNIWSGVEVVPLGVVDANRLLDEVPWATLPSSREMSGRDAPLTDAGNLGLFVFTKDYWKSCDPATRVGSGARGVASEVMLIMATTMRKGGKWPPMQK
jgi:hypothetical protein